MFDNWTSDEFFNKVLNEGGFDAMASYAGRLAIIDDPELEKAWDQFVQAWSILESKMTEWNNV